jgi:molybdate transport system substrate-binding protein
MQFNLLSAGAAQGLVNSLQQRFTQASGCTVNATFGAVGAMQEKFDAGAPADAIILTRAQIDALAAAGRVRADSRIDLGVVRTGVALKEGVAPLRVDTADELRAALRAAAEIHFPDPLRATAGIHFARVIDALAMRAEIDARLRPHPNGATAMRALAASPNAGAIGCTQKTEILATPGVRWIGALPREFELATVYTAAVTTSAQWPQQAVALLALLSGDDTHELRLRLGFEDR